MLVTLTALETALGIGLPFLPGSDDSTNESSGPTWQDWYTLTFGLLLPVVFAFAYNSFAEIQAKLKVEAVMAPLSDRVAREIEDSAGGGDTVSSAIQREQLHELRKMIRSTIGKLNEEASRAFRRRQAVYFLLGLLASVPLGVLVSWIST